MLLSAFPARTDSPTAVRIAIRFGLRRRKALIGEILGLLSVGHHSWLGTKCFHQEPVGVHGGILSVSGVPARCCAGNEIRMFSASCQRSLAALRP